MTGDYDDDVDDDDDSDDDCDNDDTDDDDDSVVLMIVITMTKLEVTEIFRTTNPLRQKWNYKNLRLTISGPNYNIIIYKGDNNGTCVYFLTRLSALTSHICNSVHFHR